MLAEGLAFGHLLCPFLRHSFAMRLNDRFMLPAGDDPGSAFGREALAFERTGGAILRGRLIEKKSRPPIWEPDL